MKKESAEKIKQIKNHVDIVEVISRDIPLERYGKNFFGKCPLCDGSKSLCISQQKQSAHCFACGASFDVFGYFQKAKRMSFPESLNEVKCFINLNNEISYKKIRKALLYILNITDGNVSNFMINGQRVWTADDEKTMLKQFSSVLFDLITDYYVLTSEKQADRQLIDDCSDMFKVYGCSLQNESDSVAETKMRNLFCFLAELCDMIKENDYNLGGMVYFHA